MPTERIRAGVVPVETWNPTSTEEDVFRYVDISSVDRENKSIVDATELAVDEAPSRARQLLKANDVLVSTVRPNLNAVAIVPDDFDGAVGSTGFTVLRANQRRLVPQYLFHWVRTPMFVADMVKKATGASYPAVSDRIVLDSEIPAPPLSEQRRIADILDKADAIRRKRQEAIALTEELLRSAFLEMFGDPVANPKGWPVEPLGKHLGFVTSGSRGWAEYYSEHGDRFIRSLDVQMDRIADEDAAYVVAPTGAEAERTRVQEEDVLLTITGSKIGRAARAMRPHAGAFISQHVAILRVLPGLDADVLAAFLVSDRGGQSLIARSQYGQTKPGLNLAQIRAFPIAVPPPQVQREIRRIRQQIRTSQSRFVDSLQTSDGLFNALVARAFSGELSS